MPGASAHAIAALCMLAATSGAAMYAQQGFAQSSQPTASSIDSASRLHAVTGGMATGVFTLASPAYSGRTLRELQLVQPVVMSSVTWRHFAFAGALNGEGFTLDRGELNAGIFGEGYVDRRHPHTLVHEAMFTWRSPQFAAFSPRVKASVSASVGKGFVPFGSDDPMTRPLEKYPVNHHHAQILERVQGIAALRFARDWQALVIELATFNGDEPAGPFVPPRWSRVGDSWSTRVTAELTQGVEVAASYATVTSPEIQQGGAFDHVQRHTGLRIDRMRANGDARYLMAEWARTDEIANGQVAFRYHSALVEGTFGWQRARASMRVELTDRAEQSRLLDPLRAPLGHIDFQILGITQWQVTTASLEPPPFSARLRGVTLRGTPFIEVSRAFPSPRNRPTAFEPREFYGRPTLWSLSLGIRLNAGYIHARMGHYGVVTERGTRSKMQHDM